KKKKKKKKKRLIKSRREKGVMEDLFYCFTYTVSLLFESGFRDCGDKMEVIESAFIKAECNKLLLECDVKTQSSVAKSLGIESLSPHVSGNPKFEYANMVE
ncbi:relaxosome protein TraM, partial [Escherichia coli]|uniref:relaxosome protein TraM n=1 Tax=Escherichia coli TaxID=562 RepID=UPI0010CC3F12